MSARPFASGNISFGLVSIPVKLYSTGEASSGIHLNMLHKKCGTRLKQQYICPLDEEVVGRDDVVKGYEYARGQYVLFTEEELKALNPEPTNAIEITEFVPSEKVDPVYFEKAYYLGPDKGGDRPYRLLAEAMRETGRAALARYAARGKDYLVLLRPYEQGLVMQQLRYQDEIKDFSEVPIGNAEVKEPELKLAVQLVDQIASDAFHPDTYEDEVRKKVRALIEQKIAGQEITAAPPEAPKAQIIDLMEALKASLAATGAGGSAEAARKPARPSPRKPAVTAEEEEPELATVAAAASAPRRRSAKR
ncbi:MAG TPA: Ku protein [Thermoanaerobaculia bacterium]|jgi:DNA end-binding protein Ku|nr:Ku protein [Thermoanaerobaculia bacterium]